VKQYRAKSTYFLTEGKANLQECLRLTFDHAVRSGTRKIVVFTGNGDGLELACKKYLNQPDFPPIQLIGVSLPAGSAPQQALHISEERQRLFEQYKIPVVRAAFPFDDVSLPNGKTRSLVHRALEFFGGGMALCINAVVIACDAGFVSPGEHVIAMSADTSILVKASPSSKMFAALAVREIICKSLIQDITKGETLAVEVNVDALLKPRKARTKALPSAGPLPSKRQIEE
jgi:uncharacterized protein